MTPTNTRPASSSAPTVHESLLGRSSAAQVAPGAAAAPLGDEQTVADLVSRGARCRVVCGACGKPIGAGRAHFLLADGRVVCGGCVSRTEMDATGRLLSPLVNRVTAYPDQHTIHHQTEDTMSSTAIRIHSFDRHRAAIGTIERALRTLDRQLYEIKRNRQLQPGDRAHAEQEARSRAEAAVREGRAALHQAIAQDRESAVYVDEPDAEAVARRSYYAAQARADLEGRRGDEAVTLCEQVLATGDRERTREYLRVARAAAQEAGLSRDLRRLELDAMDDSEKMHRAFGVAIEAVAANTGWLDRHVEGLLRQAGEYSQEQLEGWVEAPEPSTRVLGLWLDRASHEAVVAGARTRAELDRAEPPEWARPQQRPEWPQPAPAASDGGAADGSAGGGADAAAGGV